MSRAGGVARWFTPAAPPERLAALRILVAAYGLVYVIARSPYWLDVARLPPHRNEAVGVLAPFAPLPVWSVAGLVGATFVALAGAVAGRWWPVTGPASALGLLVLTTHGNSWQQVFHTENLLVLHLLVLAAAPAADVWSGDAARRPAPVTGRAPASSRETVASWRYGWAVRTMALVTVSAYVLAGVAKLRIGGWEWLTGDALRNHVAYDNLRKILLGDVSSPVAPHVLRHEWLFRPIGPLTLLVELGAPIALLGGRLRTAWVATTWSFHLMVLVLMAILFPYPLLGLAFAPLFAVERPVRPIGARLGRPDGRTASAGGRRALCETVTDLEV